MICPECDLQLLVDKKPNGAFWQCGQCSGVAVNLAVLKRHLQPDIVRDFWRRLHTTRVSTRKCPSCLHPLETFSEPIDHHVIELDLCKRCQLVWFDEGELAAFPEHRVPEDDLSPEIKQELALYKIRYGQEYQDHMGVDSERFNKWAGLAVDIIYLIIRLALRI